MDYELFNVAEEQKKNPLCVKIDPKTELPTVTLGVAYLRDICRGISQASCELTAVKLRENVMEERNLSTVFFEAFELSYRLKFKMLDFHYMIYDEDVEYIIEDCQKFGIDEFTISYNIDLQTLKLFTDKGCELAGMTTIKTGDGEEVAIKIKIKKEGLN